ncbi:hypothetical protein C0J52_12750, partial [Blattella germanica]
IFFFFAVFYTKYDALCLSYFKCLSIIIIIKHFTTVQTFYHEDMDRFLYDHCYCTSLN